MDNAPKKPVLLIVTTTYPRWGNDTDPPFVHELAKRLVSSFDVTVHCPHYPGSKRLEIMSGVKVHRFRYFLAPFEKIAGQTAILPFLRSHKGYLLVLPFFLLAQFFSMLVLVRKLKPDVIHAHWIIPTGLFAVLCRGSHPVILTAHGADVFSMRGRLFNFLKRVALEGCTAVTVVSTAILMEIKSLATTKCRPALLPMGVDDSKFSADTDHKRLKQELGCNENVLLYVGRLTEKKGVHVLLQAFQLVLEDSKNITLVVVGDGENREQLLDQVDALKIKENVVFTGAFPNENLPPYYAMADIFIGPSIVAKDGDTEGFGLTFLEASFSGCYLIGSKVGGITDIIIDGKTGATVEPGNSQDVAEKILWALENPDSVQQQKDKSKEILKKKYSWDIIATEYAKIYLELAISSKRAE